MSKKRNYQMSSLKPDRSVARLPVAVLFAVASLVTAKRAAAQVDTNPVTQNVLLLVDTSGSMEFANDGSNVQCAEVDGSLSTVTNPKGPSQKSRWTQLVEVLTGDVTNYACYSQDRSSAAFLNEYTLGTSKPYDYNYHVPYHRILSGATECTIGAGIPDANPFAWGATPFTHHLWSSAASACTTFQQTETGLLDSYRDNIRFGLMTFDTSVEAGTGLSGLGSADFDSGNTGTWSYFLNWRTNPTCNSNGDCAKGNPAGCSTMSPMEVGARNAAAPPWEGRMIPFGSPSAAIADVRATNDHIQQVLTAVRPFGATPINGLLNDASVFLKDDGDSDYTTGAPSCQANGTGCFGPNKDPYVLSQNPTTHHPCRANNIVLLTDGEPNLDLRPYCEGTSGGLDGVCPYKKQSWEIAQDLASQASGYIKTYVIGFAVSTVSTTSQPEPVDCSNISAHSSAGDTFDPNGLCGPTMDPKLSACCTLAKIAFYGGTTNALFATNATELRAKMAEVLGQIFHVQSTRTIPVFASNARANTTGNKGGSDAFFSEFASGTGAIWSGVLRRQRTLCLPNPASTSTIIEPTVQPIDEEQGDVFSKNVNAADGSHPRVFYTVSADVAGDGKRHSEGSIRPVAANTDGIGSVIGTPVPGGVNDFFAPKVSADMMGQLQKSACTELPLPGTNDECAAMFMKWELGADPTPYSKTRLDVFGAIYHSTPTFVGQPADFLRDESYTQFTVEQVKRPPVLYTSTTDGQLHAFKVDIADDADTFKIDKKVNNELWSLFPPAVLPRIASQYPSAQQVLLDGVPVVKDVVFARNDAEAKNGGGSVKWHTVLLSGFGAGGTGYFAVDVTNPVPSSSDPNLGPKLLWQLTTDDAGNRLFGKRGGTPAIATLFFSLDGGVPQEYAVAILPGGESDAAVAGPGPTPFSCQRDASPAHVDTIYPARTDVRCWTDDPARSLTIVLLETGEVVRSFRRQADGPASILPRSRDASNLYTALAAPISGQPVIYPSETGTVSDRTFVGDRDGMVWRIDFSKTDPRTWTMDLFFDTYQSDAFNQGQPIATPPILSVDALGNVTMNVSTGDQETFVNDINMRNYVWSLKEDPAATPPFSSKVNWKKLLTGGERVSGPMMLFSSNLHYTTYNPPLPTDACSFGQSKLCTVNYLVPFDPMDPASGGAMPGIPALQSSATDPCIPLADQVVFGPGITQSPTCFTDDTYNDPYLGTQQHSGLANVNPGTFSLVVQTGKLGNDTSPNGSPNTLTFALPQPRASTRIDSWAAVVE